jgi:hypothetical protein
MISKKVLVALAISSIGLLLNGCVSFESEVFTSTSAVPASDEKLAMYAQTGTPSSDDQPAVDLSSISPR